MRNDWGTKKTLAPGKPKAMAMKIGPNVVPKSIPKNAKTATMEKAKSLTAKALKKGK